MNDLDVPLTEAGGSRLSPHGLNEHDRRAGALLAKVMTARGKASALQYRDLLDVSRNHLDARAVALALVLELHRLGDMQVMAGLPEAFSRTAVRNRRGQWGMVAAEGADPRSFEDVLHRLRVWYGEVFSWAYRFGFDGNHEQTDQKRAGKNSAEVIGFPAPVR